MVYFLTGMNLQQGGSAPHTRNNPRSQKPGTRSSFLMSHKVCVQPNMASNGGGPSRLQSENQNNINDERLRDQRLVAAAAELGS